MKGRCLQMFACLHALRERRTDLEERQAGPRRSGRSLLHLADGIARSMLGFQEMSPSGP